MKSVKKYRTNNKNNKIDTNDNKSSPIEDGGIIQIVIVVVLSVVMGAVNYSHIAHLQEHNLMFSHLSGLERELSFRTEMGFYYSFYKQVIESPGGRSALGLLLADNLTEYPATINALQRFNVYPELVLGLAYRAFVSLTRSIGVETSVCYTVNRGDSLPPVRSCDGIGEPAQFYVAVVLAVNGLTVSCLFALGHRLAGGSLLGALVATGSFFFNHRECTRVQWTPPLRESFSFPFLMMQQFVLVCILGKRDSARVSIISKICFVISTLISLLSWQFAQFALLTQCIAIFISYLIAGDDGKKTVVQETLILLIIADLANVILQFGNTLLLTGPLRPCLIMALVIITFEKSFIPIYFFNSIWMPVRWLFLLILLFLSTGVLKYIIGFILQIKSDDHMFDILRSKFSNFSSFDSLLYTCAPEFDFYDLSSITQITLTGLLPLSVCSMTIILFYTLYKWLSFLWRKSQVTSDNEITVSGFCEISEYYLFFQTIAYVIMAGLIMRLKLFATPQLCIMASLLFNKKWPLVHFTEYLNMKLLNLSGHDRLNDVFKRLKMWPIILIFALCSVKGYQNLKSEWAIHGSYSNWEQEQLMNYIMSNTHPGDSFTGQMATMATVRLVTGRPIVIHPHYEDEELRSKVHIAYTVYSKKSIREVWFLLRSKLQAKYLIYEHAHCQLRPSKPGCSYLEMWDIEDPKNANGTSLCLYFDDLVKRIHMNRHHSESGPNLDTYFKWKFTTDNMGYSLFEIVDVP